VAACRLDRRSERHDEKVHPWGSRGIRAPCARLGSPAIPDARSPPVRTRLDAIAARDGAGKLWLAVTNLDPNRSVTVEATVADVTPKSAAGETLTAPRVDSINSFDLPRTVAPKTMAAKVQGSTVAMTLEPKSVTVISVEE
jgi:alpha-L-arabinofuranosidase